MTESKTLPLRSQVPIEETWDLESIFPTPSDWEAAGCVPVLGGHYCAG